MNIFNKEYFRKRDKQCEKALAYSEYCYRRAMFFKKLYEITRWKWTKERNEYYVNEGMKLLIANLAIISTIDIPALNKIIHEGE